MKKLFVILFMVSSVALLSCSQKVQPTKSSSTYKTRYEIQMMAREQEQYDTTTVQSTPTYYDEYSQYVYGNNQPEETVTINFNLGYSWGYPYTFYNYSWYYPYPYYNYWYGYP